MEPVIDDPAVVSVLVQSFPDADAAKVATRWRNDAWPEQVHTLTVFEEVGGGAVVVYAQLTADAPPAELAEWGHYRRYRSTPRLNERAAEFFAINTFDSPSWGTAQKWIDAVQVLEGNAGVPEGIIDGHAHIKTDGSGLLNYSAWTGASAHTAFLSDGVLLSAFAELPPPGAPGPVNGGFRVHTALTAP